MGRDEGPPGEPGLVCDEVERRRGAISFGAVGGRWDGGHGPTLVSVWLACVLCCSLLFSFVLLCVKRKVQRCVVGRAGLSRGGRGVV